MSMKVFDLSCGHGHSFEGWFASAEAFESQLGRGLVECPFCGAKSIRRMPSAPRLNLSSPAPAGAQSPADEPPQPTAQQLRELWLKAARYVRDNTEDVGARFAEEARRIHYDEAPVRAIRGVASRDETRALADEGIEVFAFPMPKGPAGPLQ